MENLKQQLITKFNQGILTEEEATQMEVFIQNGEIDLDQLESFQLFSNEIIHEDPSAQVDEKFHAMLAAEIKKSEKKKQSFNWFANLPLGIKWALPALLLCCGFLLGKNYQLTQGSQYAQVDLNPSDAKHIVTDLTDSKSTHNRLKAVSQITESTEQDDQIIRLLFLSLNHDKSSNVRIAAIESLIKYADKSEVRKGLIEAIRSQESPMVIQYLSEALKIIGEKVTLEQFRKLYNDDLPVEVIEQIEPNLKTFKI